MGAVLLTGGSWENVIRRALLCRSSHSGLGYGIQPDLKNLLFIQSCVLLVKNIEIIIHGAPYCMFLRVRSQSAITFRGISRV